jgi:hypothetical protein
MISTDVKGVIFKNPHFILTFVYNNSTFLIFIVQEMKKYKFYSLIEH